MAVKKTVSRTRAKVGKKVGRVIERARHSLKLIETLERDAISKARSFANLRRLGIATTEDLEKLRLRIERLEGELAAYRNATSSDRVLPQG